MDEEARQTVRDLRHAAAYEVSRQRRKKVEMLFAHLKRHLGFRRLRLRGFKEANEEFLLAATARNLNLMAIMVPSSGSKLSPTTLAKSTAFERDYSGLGKPVPAKHNV